MDTILEGLIRIAHANPELRAEILPVVKEAKGGLAKTPEAAKRMWEKYKKKNPGTKKRPSDFYDRSQEGERREKSDKEKSKAEKGEDATKERTKKLDKKKRDQKKRQNRIVLDKADKDKIQAEVKGLSGDKLQSESEAALKEISSAKLDLSKISDINKALDIAKEEWKESGYYRFPKNDRGSYFRAVALLSKLKKEKGGGSQQKSRAKAKTKALAKKHKISDKGVASLRKYLTSKATSGILNKDEQDFYDGYVFKAMMAAIMDEEELGGGKQASFRSQVATVSHLFLTRLAHANPKLRTKLLPLIKEARDKKQALDRDARSEFSVSGIAGGMTLRWTVKVFAKNQREADKAAETLVWSASPYVEWSDSRGRPLRPQTDPSREVIPTKAQLNYMDIEAD